MTVLAVAAVVNESLAVFSVVGVGALLLDAIARRLRPPTSVGATTPGALVESDPRLDLVVLGVVSLAALGALIAGVTLDATGVGLLDAVLTLLVLVGVTLAVDGTTRAGGTLSLVSTVAAVGVYALAAFGHDETLAVVLAAAAALTLASSAMDPAVLGRIARVLGGFGIALGALLLDVVPGAGRPVLTPLLLLALFILDALAVVIARVRRSQPLHRPRADHLPDRLRARGWPSARAVALLAVVQLVLSGVAVFSGRAVLATGVAAAVGLVVVAIVAVLASKATLPPAPIRPIARWVKLAVGVLVVFVVLAAVPPALAAKSSYDHMERGRDEAKAGLSAARDGDTAGARRAFQTAAREFSAARDKLESPLIAPSLAIPYLASNLRAARTLASIGTDLAEAGESLSAAVQPDSLDVVDGRLPLEQVRAITPKLEQGARVLGDADARLAAIRDDPYLVPQISEAIDSVRRQLSKAHVEADHASTAARIAPALFGGDGPRRYLLVVQNNAEARATGGFIGNFGVLTADNGDLDVDRLKRTREWNEPLAVSQPTLEAPDDYKRRYAQYAPEYTLQNVNLSPDFPTVGKVLMSLAPKAGVGPVDGVMAIDPAGLAALLELTGPVEVEGWPEPITAENVVDIALKDEYVAFAETPERANFLGDVAQAAVDKATSENLGRPPQIAKVLGKAAHEGHITFAFARPEEQRLAQMLGVDGGLGPARPDSVAVTTSNAGANKIDAYLQRTLDTQVHLDPESDGESASVRSTVSVALANEAPATGLPQIVIGPYKEGFVAGENRALVAVYSPLDVTSTAIDGTPTAFNVQRELGRNVASTMVKIPAESTKTVSVGFDGPVPLRDGWYTLRLDHQPTYKTDAVKVAITVPDSWKIDKAVRAKIDGPQRATADFPLDRTTTVRIHVTRSQNASLWDRLNSPN